MVAYLLTWNPKAWEWDDFQKDLQSFAHQGYLSGRWSTGHTKRIKKGDRVFLLRQGQEPRGIIGSGEATSSVFPDEHWDGSGRDCNYVEFRLDTFLDYRKTILSRKTLLSNVPNVNWDTQASGISVAGDSLKKLDELWSKISRKTVGKSPPADEHEPLDIPSKDRDKPCGEEGAPRTVKLTVYERDPAAREACIRHWGENCQICGFSFESVYGKIGRGYIHVHHIVPISSDKKKTRPNPRKDLIPLCPNCHAMVHRNTSSAVSVAELRKIVARTSKRPE